LDQIRDSADLGLTGISAFLDDFEDQFYLQATSRPFLKIKQRFFKKNSSNTLLKDVLHKYPSIKIVLNIDKAEHFKTIDSEYDPSQLSRIIFCSDNFEILKNIPEFRSVHIMRASNFKSLEKHAQEINKYEINAVCLPHTDISKGTTTLFQKFDIEVYGRSATSLRELAVQAQAGVNSLWSTNPEYLSAIKAEYSG